MNEQTNDLMPHSGGNVVETERAPVESMPEP
jgi:hypothetical protein